MSQSLSACHASVTTRVQVPRTYSGERSGFLGFQEEAVGTLQVRQEEITYRELNVHKKKKQNMELVVNIASMEGVRAEQRKNGVIMTID